MQLIRRPVVLVPVAALGVLIVVSGLYLFQPWKLFTNTTVDEASPIAVSASAQSTAQAPTPMPSASETSARSAAMVSATGAFISHEHGTSGTASIITLPDGKRVLRIEDLDTSNGPDLKVWLTDAPVIDGPSGWLVFDDGAYVDLGALKGNKGSQNYAIPDDADLSDLTSVSIWCDRFSVSFGAAELAPVRT
ncbi:MAG: DM13 domain-containing protein [Candidatus Nanopelagicales bacterium]|nr:DM13 domain-containing protein [Candidatus Nanopelagicales bacterium]